jgi:putative transposase
VLHVTIGVTGRQKILATPEVQAAFVDAWRNATHWLAGRYVIMPDHVHFFCVPGVIDHPPVRRWAGYWKRLVGKQDPALARVFQENCWDTQMRSREHYEEKVSYVQNNPVRAGLVSVSEDWPFQGQVHDVPLW